MFITFALLTNGGRLAKIRPMKTATLLSFVALSFTTVGCLPEHLNTFDGRVTTAKYSKTLPRTFALKDEQGSQFWITSKDVAVKFEINSLSPSKMYVTDNGHTAKFELPKSVLNGESDLIEIPGRVSGQTVDLVAQEKKTILKTWKTYRHTSTPIYTTSYDSQGNATQIYAGEDDDYYENTEGTVKRDFTINVYYKHASERQYPEELKLGVFTMTVKTSDERLRSKSISSSAYRANKKN